MNSPPHDPIGYVYAPIACQNKKKKKTGVDDGVKIQLSISFPCSLRF